MKLSPISTLVFVISLLASTALAAAAALPAPAGSNEVSTSLSMRAGTSNDDLPPAPYSMRIKDTDILLIFGKFGGPPGLDPRNVLWILFVAQSEIVKGVVENKGDGAIRTPNLIWRHGLVYVTVNQQLKLPWSLLSKSLVGIHDFFGAYYETTCSVSIFDTKAGIMLGEVVVGRGF